jgi:exopolyphosphatase/guanosine-5'-triphosphate,3'-diphosphate pyrophosphatase
MILKNNCLDNVINMGQSWGFEKKHACQVSRISLMLFDHLQNLHRMGNTERLWIEIAAILHDAGKNINKECHHKLARDIIVDCSFLPFGRKQRKIIGLIARYHRGRLPDDKHKYFNQLDDESRKYVCKLAAILRIADGLVHGTSKKIKNLTCSINRHTITVHLECTEHLDIVKARKKANLFEETYTKNLIFCKSNKLIYS